MSRATFTPLTQTILSDPDHGIHGNCFATCVAAITGIADVPNFAQAGEGAWFTEFWTWCHENNWDGYTAHKDLPSDLLIAIGKGPRGFNHAVLWLGGADGMIVWDPHPDRTGLVGKPANWITLERAEKPAGETT